MNTERTISVGRKRAPRNLSEEEKRRRALKEAEDMQRGLPCPDWRLFSRKQAAAMLGISPSKLSLLMAQRKIGWVVNGGNRSFRYDQLKAYADSRDREEPAAYREL